MNNDKNVNFNAGIFFIKLILTVFISSVVAFFIISQFNPVFSVLLIPFLCIIFYLPLIVIFVVITLLLNKYKTPFVAGKFFNLFFVIIGILLIVIQIGFIWPNVSPTYQRNLRPSYTSFSNDNSRLFVFSEGRHIVSLEPDESIYEYYVWDIDTGEVIWNKTTFEYVDLTLSPGGEYLINNYNDSIFSLSLNRYMGNQFGEHIIWAQDGKSFITYNETNISIWETINFTLIHSIIYDNAEKILPSVDGSKIAIIPEGNGIKTLSVINITNNNSVYVFNTSISNNAESVIWSEDGSELQIVSRISGIIFGSGGDYVPYNVVVWNITNNTLVQNTSFKHYFGEHGNNGLEEIWFGKYVVSDFDNNQLVVYSFDGKKEQTYGFLDYERWSYDKELLAYYSYIDGNIKILNTTTNKIIRTFALPTYEFKRMIPGFEIIPVVCAVALVLFWKRKMNL